MGTVGGRTAPCHRAGTDRPGLGGATAITIDIGLQSYLKQINHAPLLTPEQEKELATTLREGREAADRFATGEMTLAQREAAEKSAAEARERMVKSNLRLVVNIAKKYVRRNTILNDLINEGNLGLIRAVEGFDPDQNTRFSTYASWWIKQSIKRALVNGVQPVHIPAYMVEMINKMRRAHGAFIDANDRAPNVAELAEAMELPERKVKIIGQAIQGYTAPTQSGESEEGISLTELMPDVKTPQPDAALFDAAQTDFVEEVLSGIDEREATILRLRFGLDSGEAMTLKEIGVEVNLTRERVRQIEGEALKKLASMFSERE